MDRRRFPLTSLAGAFATALAAEAEQARRVGRIGVLFARGARIMVCMVMPGLSGTDVLAALRRAGLTVPVILISGQIHRARRFSRRPQQAVQTTEVFRGRGGRSGPSTDHRWLDTWTGSA
jgi:glyoxylate carboligase